MSETSGTDAEQDIALQVRRYIDRIGNMPTIDDSQVEVARVSALIEIGRLLGQLSDRVQDAFFSFVGLTHNFQELLASVEKQLGKDGLGDDA